MFKPLRHTIKLFPALVATAAVSAVAAPTASADTAPTAWLQGGVLAYTGVASNDRLDVSKVASGSYAGGYALKLEIYSWLPPYFSANCTEGGPQGHWVVMCPAQGVNKITYQGNGGGGDSFINNTSVPSEAHGGPGYDLFHGGDGPDVFYGEGGTDELYGNYGDDVIDGGPGADIMGGGKGGTDIASWADADAPVNVSMDNLSNDGVAGENDYVPKDFEGIQGSPYGDTLSGRGLDPDILLGGGGPDDLQGYGGDDTLRGEAGSDTLRANSGADVLDGGADTDSLSYGEVANSVYVYQDGAANDGLLGEHDNVTSVEHLGGSKYDDDLEGTSG